MFKLFSLECLFLTFPPYWSSYVEKHFTLLTIYDAKPHLSISSFPREKGGFVEGAGDERDGENWKYVKMPEENV